MLKKITDLITHNWMWKLLSVLFAFLFWWAVVSSEDPVKDEVFENIPVNKINVESVTDNNYAIEYLEGEYVDIRVSAKRSVIEKLTEEDIYAFADISNMSITNAIDIEVNIDGEYQSYDIFPANMKVKIEGVITETKEVQYLFEGEPAEDYIALTPTITPSVIQVTGPESQINKISSVIVSIPIDQAKRDVTLFYKPEILDAQNNPVPKVQANIDEVGITVPVQLTKSVYITFEPFDQVPEGYQLIDVQLDKSSIVVRGSEDDLEGLDEIVIDNISLAGIVNDVTSSVYLEEYLPANVEINGIDTDISVSIDVEPIIQKTLPITHGDIDVKNLPNGLIFAFSGEEEIELTVEGIPVDLEDVTLERLDPYIQLTDLEAGEHEVVVNYYIPYGVQTISEEQVVKITLTEDESVSEDSVEESQGSSDNSN